jgi:hypothetical protein
LIGVIEIKTMLVLCTNDALRFRWLNGNQSYCPINENILDKIEQGSFPLKT